MATTVYTASIEAIQNGDIVLNPTNRVGGASKIDATQSRAEVVSGAEFVTITSSDDKLTHNVRANGTAGDVVLNVIADKNIDPTIEDDEIGEWHITITEPGTSAVAMTLNNVKDNA